MNDPRSAMVKSVLQAMALAWILVSSSCPADEFKVATASNFRGTMLSLAERFERITGHKAILIFGSTGKHYAQIIHGAPFDAFFAADAERPALLEQQGQAVAGSRFTYARGRLALFRPGETSTGLDRDYLATGSFRHLAIANPDLAPYGRAAVETLETLDLLEPLRQRLVTGENAAQAFQFLVSGSAELGFVAWPQLKAVMDRIPGDHWLVPAKLHRPIDQQAVLLSEKPAAREFMLFVQSDEAITVIREHGYLVP